MQDTVVLPQGKKGSVALKAFLLTLILSGYELLHFGLNFSHGAYLLSQIR